MSEQDVKDFIEYCGITASASTLKKIDLKIRQIDTYFKGDMSNLNIKDIHKFLSNLNQKGYAPSTRNDIIKIFKRFLKWKYKDWNERFDEMKELKATSNDQRNLSKEDLLTPDEMQIIVNATDSMKYKTLLLLFQETAARPEELLKLKWKDVNLDGKEVKLHSSKTKKIRTIPVHETVGHLKRYKAECFYEPPKAEDKVFNMKSQAVISYILRIENKLKFKKHLYPYLWRHSVLTRMIKSLTPKTYEMYAGHSLETGMKIYAHLDNDDLRDELNTKIYKIEELTKEENQKLKIMEKELAQQKKIIERFKEFLEEQAEINQQLLEGRATIK